MTKSILIIGTLDTKGDEHDFLRKLINDRGHKTIMMDTGVAGDPKVDADIHANEVAEAGGISLKELRDANDRGKALEIMGAGAKLLTLKLYKDGLIDGVISLGGSGGTSVATTAMRALPVGIPKVMVSTMASGDASAYVGVKDITMMFSVVDVSGINRISRQVFANAAGAVCGMAEQIVPKADDKHLIAASMFGVTTPCVTQAREEFEKAGYEVLVFHATGSGGKAMESLIEDGFISGVADITTTEWCDELVGGVLSAGKKRLDAAAEKGVPQVVSLGALDMVNFGGMETVPSEFKDRNLYVHNPQVTLMRTTPDECTKLGEIIASKLNKANGPAALFIPLKGVSMIDAEGQPFHSPEADKALFDSIRENIDTSKVEVIELDMNLNDPEFSHAMVEKLLELLKNK